ncbi:hypothetical protein BESB_068220 [Besnoitia besnoiti]|uniref:Uncharacterized protein n=1 Tax=Besnoitia besnoiti TaxID=94643 RepID=A0A2A9MA55_BESBE|nr:hypothetical protein BESB_068220 [Besnoitia besnoiti]PFH34789.1 hypothetical protein BESB_068220 [Besnoitia besnoiti]
MISPFLCDGQTGYHLNIVVHLCDLIGSALLDPAGRQNLEYSDSRSPRIAPISTSGPCAGLTSPESVAMHGDTPAIQGQAAGCACVQNRSSPYRRGDTRENVFSHRSCMTMDISPSVPGRLVQQQTNTQPCTRTGPEASRPGERAVPGLRASHIDHPTSLKKPAEDSPAPDKGTRDAPNPRQQHLPRGFAATTGQTEPAGRETASRDSQAATGMGLPGHSAVEPAVGQHGRQAGGDGHEQLRGHWPPPAPSDGGRPCATSAGECGHASPASAYQWGGTSDANGSANALELLLNDLADSRAARPGSEFAVSPSWWPDQLEFDKQFPGSVGHFSQSGSVGHFSQSGSVGHLSQSGSVGLSSRDASGAGAADAVANVAAERGGSGGRAMPRPGAGAPGADGAGQPVPAPMGGPTASRDCQAATDMGLPGHSAVEPAVGQHGRQAGGDGREQLRGHWPPPAPSDGGRPCATSAGDCGHASPASAYQWGGTSDANGSANALELLLNDLADSRAARPGSEFGVSPPWWPDQLEFDKLFPGSVGHFSQSGSVGHLSQSGSVGHLSQSGSVGLSSRDASGAGAADAVANVAAERGGSGGSAMPRPGAGAPGADGAGQPVPAPMGGPTASRDSQAATDMGLPGHSAVEPAVGQHGRQAGGDGHEQLRGHWPPPAASDGGRPCATSAGDCGHASPASAYQWGGTSDANGSANALELLLNDLADSRAARPGSEFAVSPSWWPDQLEFDKQFPGSVGHFSQSGSVGHLSQSGSVGLSSRDASGAGAADAVANVAAERGGSGGSAMPRPGAGVPGADGAGQPVPAPMGGPTASRDSQAATDMGLPGHSAVEPAVGQHGRQAGGDGHEQLRGHWPPPAASDGGRPCATSAGDCGHASPASAYQWGGTSDANGSANALELLLNDLADSRAARPGSEFAVSPPWWPDQLEFDKQFPGSVGHLSQSGSVGHLSQSGSVGLSSRDASGAGAADAVANVAAERGGSGGSAMPRPGAGAPGADGAGQPVPAPMGGPTASRDSQAATDMGLPGHSAVEPAVGQHGRQAGGDGHEQLRGHWPPPAASDGGRPCATSAGDCGHASPASAYQWGGTSDANGSANALELLLNDLADSRAARPGSGFGVSPPWWPDQLEFDKEFPGSVGHFSQSGSVGHLSQSGSVGHLSQSGSVGLSSRDASGAGAADAVANVAAERGGSGGSTMPRPGAGAPGADGAGQPVPAPMGGPTASRDSQAATDMGLPGHSAVEPAVGQHGRQAGGDGHEQLRGHWPPPAASDGGRPCATSAGDCGHASPASAYQWGGTSDANGSANALELLLNDLADSRAARPGSGFGVSPPWWPDQLEFDKQFPGSVGHFSQSGSVGHLSQSGSVGLSSRDASGAGAADAVANVAAERGGSGGSTMPRPGAGAPGADGAGQPVPAPMGGPTASRDSQAATDMGLPGHSAVEPAVGQHGRQAGGDGHEQLRGHWPPPAASDGGRPCATSAGDCGHASPASAYQWGGTSDANGSANALELLLNDLADSRAARPGSGFGVSPPWWPDQLEFDKQFPGSVGHFSQSGSVGHLSQSGSVGLSSRDASGAGAADAVANVAAERGGSGGSAMPRPGAGAPGADGAGQPVPAPMVGPTASRDSQAASDMGLPGHSAVEPAVGQHGRQAGGDGREQLRGHWPPPAPSDGGRPCATSAGDCGHASPASAYQWGGTSDANGSANALELLLNDLADSRAARPGSEFAVSPPWWPDQLEFDKQFPGSVGHFSQSGSVGHLSQSGSVGHFSRSGSVSHLSQSGSVGLSSRDASGAGAADAVANAAAERGGSGGSAVPRPGAGAPGADGAGQPVPAPMGGPTASRDSQAATDMGLPGHSAVEPAVGQHGRQAGGDGHEQLRGHWPPPAASDGGRPCATSAGDCGHGGLAAAGQRRGMQDGGGNDDLLGGFRNVLGDSGLLSSGSAGGTEGELRQWGVSPGASAWSSGATLSETQGSECAHTVRNIPRLGDWYNGMLTHASEGRAVAANSLMIAGMQECRWASRNLGAPTRGIGPAKSASEPRKSMRKGHDSLGEIPWAEEAFAKSGPGGVTAQAGAKPDATVGESASRPRQPETRSRLEGVFMHLPSTAAAQSGRVSQLRFTSPSAALEGQNPLAATHGRNRRLIPQPTGTASFAHGVSTLPEEETGGLIMARIEKRSSSANRGRRSLS